MVNNSAKDDLNWALAAYVTRNFKLKRALHMPSKGKHADKKHTD